ncbi:hypothetical protein Leryth_008945 [Lithospermum erythrorhizon]|nr:hypothetical protein Leryth_008945 [Lithospermum erythrorhizon]
MEHRNMLMSAVGVGVGVGVGIGLVSGKGGSNWASNGIKGKVLENEMLHLVVDGKNSKVTFDQFPYYLSEQTRVLLTSAAFVHLNKGDFYKHTMNLSPASRTILLSGPAELYQQMLAKAFSLMMAKLYFRWVDFSLKKMLKKLSGPVLILGSRTVEPGYDFREVDEKISSVFPYNIEIKPPADDTHSVSWKSQLEDDMKMIRYQDNRNHIIEVLAANDIVCDDLSSICISDTMILSSHIDEIVMSAISHHLMNTERAEYRGGKLVISSASLSHGLNIFQEEKSPVNDTMKLEAQAKMPEDALSGPAVGLNPGTITESSATDKPAEAAAAPAPAPATVQDSDNLTTHKEELPDNEFEKHIRPEVIPASELSVTFADIGALDEIKESLQELVMLPLRRPDLFEGGLLKPCRGILLFGPPGTGKTMTAKAIAKEAGASFINVSMSTITSKWFGEDEKNVRALFTLAAKVSPTIIFVDEVDSMLGQRSRAGEHEAMRKIKNEFMTQWDGLLTKPGERILVLAATNRPFDLDEAIIRRFERRVMVGLPSDESREKILRTLLAKEKVDEGIDYKELATMTQGFSGSDMKNFCTTAAYRPVRELIKQERLRDLEQKNRAEKDNAVRGFKQPRTVTIRPLNMEDFKEAKSQVAASFSSEGSIMADLKQWNEQYGEGGSRKKEQLSYFLFASNCGSTKQLHLEYNVM